MNYLQLQTETQDYLHRTDLTAKMPGFVALAESYLFRELAISDTDKTVTGTASGTIALPADFLQMVRLTLDVYGIERELDYWKDPQPGMIGTGTPRFYALETNAIRLYPAPASATTYTLYYTPKLSALSPTNTSNWLLENAPDLYMYSTALEAAKYIRDNETLQTLAAMLPAMLESVRSLSKRRGIPSAGGLRMRQRQ